MQARTIKLEPKRLFKQKNITPVKIMYLSQMTSKKVWDMMCNWKKCSEP